jgi:hypothetical protein
MGLSRVTRYQSAPKAFRDFAGRFIIETVAFPIKICAVCEEEFELKPDKPGFANRCPDCSAAETAVPETKGKLDADERKNLSEANEARRQAMRQLLYRKDN